MKPRIIPKYYDYELIGRTRMDAVIALANADPLLIARGLVDGSYPVNKFGRNIEIDADVVADTWDGGHTSGSGGTSLIWVAPTQARVHIIASTDAGDDGGSPLGAGARTVQIWGLTDWDTKEVSEIVTMNSASPLTSVTVNAYVIIHQMEVLTKGATDCNIGEITATAAVDGTVTARIRPGQGQTQMAIIGIPSTQKLFMGRVYGNMNKASGVGANTGYVDVAIRFNSEPQNELTNFVVRHPFGLSLNGTSALTINYDPPKRFVGPAIIKMQIASGTANMDVSSGFDGVLIDNA